MTRELDLILLASTDACGVTVHELRGEGRNPHVVLAREVCVTLCREMTNASFPEIAAAMGRPNHSSVMTAYQRATDRAWNIDDARSVDFYRAMRAARAFVTRELAKHEARFRGVSGAQSSDFMRGVA